MKKYLLSVILLSFGFAFVPTDYIPNYLVSTKQTLVTAKVAKLIMSRNPDRRRADICNDSTVTIYLNEKNATPTASFGVRLAAGEKYQLNASNPSVEQWYAICSSANKVIRVMEGSRK
jgi:hypothetical protein